MDAIQKGNWRRKHKNRFTTGGSRIMGSFFVGAVVFAIVGLAAYKVYRDIKAGKRFGQGCACDCENCPGCPGCNDGFEGNYTTPR